MLQIALFACRYLLSHGARTQMLHCPLSVTVLLRNIRTSFASRPIGRPTRSGCMQTPQCGQKHRIMPCLQISGGDLFKKTLIQQSHAIDGSEL
ncbi:hypothetical protein BDW75DRAFT_219868, partial [Aspergillus navahoensis]